MVNAHTTPAIGEETRVEELVEACPEAVKVLLREGIRCIRCGEPVWGTLGDLLRESGVSDPKPILELVNKACQRPAGS
jgi:methionine synthase II (cobalamin-independent)